MPLAGKIHGEFLKTAHQQADRHDQQQSVDVLRVAQIVALQLEVPGFLVAEQLFGSRST
ncbi:MAG: hypothetical protein WAM11_11490 [Cyanobium sp.]